eukprot:SAG31_NODE_308_length_17951_cov_4.779240_8_plen_179_part_00
MGSATRPVNSAPSAPHRRRPWARTARALPEKAHRAPRCATELSAPAAHAELVGNHAQHYLAARRRSPGGGTSQRGHHTSARTSACRAIAAPPRTQFRAAGCAAGRHPQQFHLARRRRAAAACSAAAAADARDSHHHSAVQYLVRVLREYRYWNTAVLTSTVPVQQETARVRNGTVLPI